MSLTYKDTEVTVKINDQDFSKTYKQIEKSSITIDYFLEQLQNPETAKQMISDWWYGQDLRAKAAVRQTILATVAGPEKAFDKAVKDFMKMREAMGKPITEDQAKRIVKTMAEMEALEETASENPVEATA